MRTSSVLPPSLVQDAVRKSSDCRHCLVIPREERERETGASSSHAQREEKKRKTGLREKDATTHEIQFDLCSLELTVEEKK